jgi:hypothetical protein
LTFSYLFAESERFLRETTPSITGLKRRSERVFLKEPNVRKEYAPPIRVASVLVGEGNNLNINECMKLNIGAVTANNLDIRRRIISF